jgi:hypothetical protein
MTLTSTTPDEVLARDVVNAAGKPLIVVRCGGGIIIWVRPPVSCWNTW